MVPQAHFTFRSHERLTHSEDFVRARREGQKRVGRHLIVWAHRRAEKPARATRLGITVGRRHGGAVQRNLFKRRIREIFRLHKEGLARGWDVLVSPKSLVEDRSSPSYQDLRADFLRLTGHVRTSQITPANAPDRSSS